MEKSLQICGSIVSRDFADSPERLLGSVLADAALELALLWSNLLGEDDRHSREHVRLVRLHERTVLFRL